MGTRATTKTANQPFGKQLTTKLHQALSEGFHYIAALEGRGEPFEKFEGKLQLPVAETACLAESGAARTVPQGQETVRHHQH